MSYYNLMDAFYSNGCLQPLLDCARALCSQEVPAICRHKSHALCRQAVLYAVR